MRTTTGSWMILLVTALLFAGGCSSRAPTIAHTHIGHAMDGWHDTPGQTGLLVTAENAAQEAHQAAEAATRPGKGLVSIRSEVERVITATRPGDGVDAAGKGKVTYGVRNALNEAVSHIEYAAESADATYNVKSSSEVFSQHAQAILDRCDLIAVLGNDILASGSREEAALLSGELLKLTRANIHGEDTNGDGSVGSAPDEYGLRQLRADIEAMIAREDPPYTTVERWYLFNLVRLPSGEWIFRQRSQAGAADTHGGY